MTSTPGAGKALEAAVLALRANLSTAGPVHAPAWLQTALRLHQESVGLDAIAVILREAGHPPEAVALAIAAVRSDVRRLGLFWSRLPAR